MDLQIRINMGDIEIAETFAKTPAQNFLTKLGIDDYYTPTIQYAINFLGKFVDKREHRDEQYNFELSELKTLIARLKTQKQLWDFEQKQKDAQCEIITQKYLEQNHIEPAPDALSELDEDQKQLMLAEMESLPKIYNRFHFSFYIA